MLSGFRRGSRDGCLLRRICSHSGVKRWRKKFVEALTADPTAANRKHGQNHERNQHNCRTLVNATVPMLVWRGRPRPRPASQMNMFTCRCFTTVLTEESKEPKPEHVEGS